MSKMKLENPITSSFAFWSLFLHAILLCFVSLLLQPTTAIAAALGNETDRFALLKFKESLTGDPHGVTSSWNDSIHFCKWPGISCGRRHQRITALDLRGYNLRGSLSPYIGNLSFLRFINVDNNSLFGEIPLQISHLRRLRHLNLSDNMLEEYAIGGAPSKEGDMYSYGILVLEMFTRRRPTDQMFQDDFNLHNFVKTALPDRLVQIVDSSLLPRGAEENALRASEYGRNNGGNNGGIEIEVEEENNYFGNRNQISAHLQKCLVSILQIGLSCSEESPNERINIGDVTKELHHIRSSFMDAENRGRRRRFT